MLTRSQGLLQWLQIHPLVKGILPQQLVEVGLRVILIVV